MADAVDKLQALNSGKTGFQSLLELTDMSEKQMETAMCIKEIAVFGVMATSGFQGAYRPIVSKTGTGAFLKGAKGGTGFGKGHGKC